MITNGEDVNIIDTRRNSEFQSEHVMGSQVYTLDSVGENLAFLDKDKTYYMYCLTGYRSASLISILKNNGYKNLINIEGGLDQIKETDIPMSEYVCPTTIL
jgi:rhodanese-related sulfurtransferase